jgi:hypothetical protein
MASYPEGMRYLVRQRVFSFAASRSSQARMNG